MAAMALALLLTAGTGAAFASASNALYIEDQKIELNQELWSIDGTSYAPVKELASRMGWQLAVDSGRITVTNAMGDMLSFRAGEPTIAYNGAVYDIGEPVKVKEGSAYFPLRMLAEAMHASVGWKAEEKAAVLRQEEAYVIQSGDTLAGIAKDHDTTAEALKTRNGLTSEALIAGESLKVVVPEFQLPNYGDAALLAKLVEVEAGNEPYEGKLAVANVVVNRLNNGHYGQSIEDVIYARGQFPPALNGEMDKEQPSKESLQAAKAALSGENNVPGALYFFNPKLEPDKVKRVTVVKKIGNHMFAK